MKLPDRLQDLLPTKTVKQLADLVDQPALVEGLRDAVKKLGIDNNWKPQRFQSAVMQAKRWAESVARQFSVEDTHLTIGINATGMLFSPEWTSLPQSDSTSSLTMAMQSSYSKALNPQDEVSELMRKICGAESTIVVPSTLVALRLLAMLSEKDKRWVTPRVDCIRVSPEHSLPSALQVLGARGQSLTSTLEVGSSSECSRDELIGGLGKDGAGVVTAFPNATQSHSLQHHDMAIECAQQLGLPSVEILNAASPVDLSEIFPGSAFLRDRLDRGLKLSIVPLNGLFGGPSCTAMLGDKTMIEELHRYACDLGVMVQDSRLAQLLPVLESVQDFQQWSTTPTGELLTTDIENLDNRGRRIATQLKSLDGIDSVELTRRSGPIFGSRPSAITIESVVLTVQTKEMTTTAFCKALAGGKTPLWCLEGETGVEVVLRSVQPDEDALVVAAFEKIFEKASEDESQSMD
jgi:L-seryl-tRNA(Ser) seleniumtransferase